jgi:hypothetical protein
LEDGVVISEALWGNFFHTFVLFPADFGAMFLAFYAFIFVFQTNLVASLEARFSHLFGFG